MADGALVNVGELAKPVTVLIEKISNAVGVLYEPTAIRRKASAEADALQLRTLGELAATDLQKRAMQRLLHQEERKQANIESITEQAIKDVPETANSSALGEDWLAYFFSQCELVSDTEMQVVWAKLLSGEATSPGSFSKRTVELVARMEKKDAALFTLFAQFVWNFGQPAPVVFDHKTPIYKDAGITFDGLAHLEALGLIQFQSLTGYSREWPAGSLFGLVTYFDEALIIENLSGAPLSLTTGQCVLTKAGQELFRVCGAKKNLEHMHHVLTRWADEGKLLYSPLRYRAK